MFLASTYDVSRKYLRCFSQVLTMLPVIIYDISRNRKAMQRAAA